MHIRLFTFRPDKTKPTQNEILLTTQFHELFVDLFPSRSVFCLSFCASIRHFYYLSWSHAFFSCFFFSFSSFFAVFSQQPLYVCSVVPTWYALFHFKSGASFFIVMLFCVFQKRLEFNLWIIYTMHIHVHLYILTPLPFTQNVLKTFEAFVRRKKIIKNNNNSNNGIRVVNEALII